MAERICPLRGFWTAITDNTPVGANMPRAVLAQRDNRRKKSCYNGFVKLIVDVMSTFRVEYTL